MGASGIRIASVALVVGLLGCAVAGPAFCQVLYHSGQLVSATADKPVYFVDDTITVDVAVKNTGPDINWTWLLRDWTFYPAWILSVEKSWSPGIQEWIDGGWDVVVGFTDIGTATLSAPAVTGSYTLTFTARYLIWGDFSLTYYDMSDIPKTIPITVVDRIIPDIGPDPVSKTVTVGQTATFTVGVTGDPTPSVQWEKQVPGGKWTDTGATGLSYTTAPATLTDNGTQFRCVATNSAGSHTSTTATLVVILTLGVRMSDLSNSPTPPNPIRVWGKVTSLSPPRLSDGSGEIQVNRLTASLGDFEVVTGDWDGTVLRVVGPYKGQMIYIPAGSFLMGNNGSEPYSYSDELPQHSVYLSGYYIGKYEVTRGEYGAFMTATGRAQPVYWDAVQDWETGDFTQTDNHPVVGVTYYDAEAFCIWAGGHLPTEAQWEKAARWTGSYPNVYPWGNTWGAENCNNWYDHNSAGGGYMRAQTAPVGSYPSDVSPYGCRDMAGNVWEWCKDWYLSDYYSQSPADDPQGPTTGMYRVFRAGSWSGYGGGYLQSRCAYRNSNYQPFMNSSNLGFRLVR